MTSPTKPPRRYLARFSLRSLLILVLFAGSGFGLWWRWDPWVVALRLGGHSSRVSDAFFSPDGSEILTSSYGVPDERQVPGVTFCEAATWDALTGNRKLIIRLGESSNLFYSSYSSDGRWIQTNSLLDSEIHAIFDAVTGEALLTEIERPRNRSLYFSPDNNALLDWHLDRPAEFWDLSRRKCLWTVQDIEFPKESHAISADGKRLAIAGASGFAGERKVLAIFDTATGESHLFPDCPVKAPLAFTPDGMRLVAALDVRDEQCHGYVAGLPVEESEKLQDGISGPATCLIDLTSGKPVRVFGDDLDYFPVMKTGGNLHFTGIHNCVVRDASTLELKCEMNGILAKYGAVTDDGKRQVTINPRCVGYGEIGWTTADAAEGLWFEEWDLEVNRRLYRIEWPWNRGEYVYSTCYAKDGRRILAASSDKTMLWDAGTSDHRISIEGSGLIENGGMFLLWRKEENLSLKDMDDGSTVAVFPGTATAERPRVSLHPSGERLALVLPGQNNEAQVWERRHPEQWWGITCLPEFWLTMVFVLLLVWSFVRDFRTLRKAAT